MCNIIHSSMFIYIGRFLVGYIVVIDDVHLHVHCTVHVRYLFIVMLCTAEEEMSKSRSAAPASDRDWLSQVEILTYAPPSRRLWMGPQFSFKAFSSSTAASPSNDPSSSSSTSAAATTSSAAVLHTPSPPNTVIYSSSLNSPTIGSGGQLSHGSFRTGVKLSPSQNSLDLGGGGGGGRHGPAVMEGGEQGEDASLQGAVLFPSPENPLLDLLSDPPEIQNLTLASIHSDALPMPTLYAGKEGTAESGSLDPGEPDMV